MVASVPSSVCAAKRPIARISLGWISPIWRSRCGEHFATSSGSGLRLPGRPALEHVGDVDVAAPARGRSRQACCRAACPPARRRARPAGPLPTRAPRRPAASRAFSSPTPNTVCVQPARSLQSVQPATFAFSCAQSISWMLLAFSFLDSDSGTSSDGTQSPDRRQTHLLQDLVAPAHSAPRQHQRVLAPAVRRVVAGAHRDLAETEAAVERLRARIARAHLEEQLLRIAAARQAHDFGEQGAAVAVPLVRRGHRQVQQVCLRPPRPAGRNSRPVRAPLRQVQHR